MEHKKFGFDIELPVLVNTYPVPKRNTRISKIKTSLVNKVIGGIKVDGISLFINRDNSPIVSVVIDVEYDTITRESYDEFISNMKGSINAIVNNFRK